MRTIRRAGAAVLAVGVAVALAGCEEASGLLPTQTVTVTAGSTPSASPPSASPTASASPSGSSSPSPSSSPSTGGAAPVSTPLPGGKGCAPNHADLRLGMTRTIGDVDGDGRADTEFFTEDRPLYFGVRTASGATIAVRDDLPGRVHRGWVAGTETGVRAAFDDERTARPYAFAHCAFTPLLTAQGDPYSTRVGQPDGTRPTGLACTNQNGGKFLSLSRLAKRSDGRFDVYWGILQSKGGERVAPDPIAGKSAHPRYTGLSADDERVTQAQESRCGDAPIVYYPDA